MIEREKESFMSLSEELSMVSKKLETVVNIDEKRKLKESYSRLQKELALSGKIYTLEDLRNSI